LITLLLEAKAERHPLRLGQQLGKLDLYRDHASAA